MEQNQSQNQERRSPYGRRGSQTSFKRDEDSKLLDLARVSRVAAGGRRFRFRALVVVGDKKGKVGIGMGKGADVAQSMEKAARKARKNMFTVPLRGETIPHQVEAKFGASRLLLKPATQGRGVVAGGVVRIICEKAGIKQVAGKFLTRSKNKLNNAVVTIKALQKLRSRSKTEQGSAPADSYAASRDSAQS